MLESKVRIEPRSEHLMQLHTFTNNHSRDLT